MTNETMDTRGAHERAQRRRCGPLARAGAGAAVAALTLALAACGGGSGGKKTLRAANTLPAETPTLANVGLKTPIPLSPGELLTAQDLASRGSGSAGRGDFTGARLLIPKIKVDAPFTVKTVPGSGVMPNPNSWDDVAYYDFSNWPGKGGTPGKGGNIVLAGHVDYIRHGPAVFWDLRELQQGDTITIKMEDGSSINYDVVFNKYTPADAGNFDQVVSATEGESMTLITCTGDFSAGHYNQRQVVWARRVGTAG
jgi:LPXTG-site transpeptidase (sortase) family protein